MGNEKLMTNATACFAAAHQLNGLEGLVVREGQGSSSVLPAGCTMTVNSTGAFAFWNTNDASNACCGAGVETIEGAQQSLVTLGLSLATKGATITMTGPDGVWFGVGFDTVSMANAPYAIIVDGAGAVTERVMGNHMAGVQINTSVQVVSNTVKAGIRTVVMQRPLKGATPQHHTFDPLKVSFSFINAIGTTSTFSHHKTDSTSSISMWPVSGPACVCAVPAAPFGKGTGTIEYLPTGEVNGFAMRCNPTESILGNHNPTCDIRTYVGGLDACHHGWHLLDAEQEVPWMDQPLEYYFKFRFYFQDYNPAKHVVAREMEWSIGGDTAEYDVPQCVPGTPVEQCTHTITGSGYAPPGTDLHFIAAHYHCHAPTCLSMEIYNNLTGELLCREEPYHGQHNKSDRFDEPGYIAQRVCLWGAPLEAPPLVSGIPLFIKAVTNNTYGHHGEMALPQMYLASIPKKTVVV